MNKYLIAGLGNIGPAYDGTRHNIGFEVLDEIIQEEKLPVELIKYAMKADWSYKGKKAVLIKPTTYMNLSGQAVQYALKEYKIDISNLIVITDDLALPLGTIRIKPKGSDGGHNGLKNINEVMNTQSYTRIRFGIGSDFSKGRQVDYVLGKWDNKEVEEMKIMRAKCVEAIKSIMHIGIERSMNFFNS